ncbi:hypothetical protein CEY04_01885 [Achromobacter sp. HZ28]|nr:hypothetical protein CEY05_01885 [Achromobacter sp. HZ34]OWT82567.1 hypothetical protein CEY04_01885 [Achromobacter sp. HZ28]
MLQSSSRLRRAMICWLYAVALGHLVVSLFLTWGGHTAPAAAYLARIEAVFWPGAVPAHTRELQQWWMSLFGATLQSYSVFMLVLVHLGNTLRAPGAWLGMMAGVLLWAPQDMYFSLSSGMTVNAWIDAAALLVLLVPVVWLYRHDRSRAPATTPGTRA